MRRWTARQHALLERSQGSFVATGILDCNAKSTRTQAASHLRNIANEYSELSCALRHLCGSCVRRVQMKHQEVCDPWHDLANSYAVQCFAHSEATPMRFSILFLVIVSILECAHRCYLGEQPDGPRRSERNEVVKLL